mgnify:FL=1|tara:strand:- start:5687 stop:5857 length:171 start_codon:yes stop_codon:yes gene_type:complete
MSKIFKTDKELIKYLRSKGDKNYNEASDDFIFEEAFTQGWAEVVGDNYIIKEKEQK